MEIRKRNGESVPFQQEKIFNAMKKAFDGQGKEIGSRELDEILATVLNNLSVTVPLTVERVQDEVERTLMERGHYEVAKAYILYREQHTPAGRHRPIRPGSTPGRRMNALLRGPRFFCEECKGTHPLPASAYCLPPAPLTSARPACAQCERPLYLVRAGRTLCAPCSPTTADLR